MERPTKFDAKTFSTLTPRIAILEPLRYLFGRSFNPDFTWDPDPEKTKIIIRSENDQIADEIAQNKPRIIYSDSGFRMDRPGLTDNMAEKRPLHLTGGRGDSTHILLISGQSRLVVESKHEGVTLLLMDMVMNFITWTEPFICNTFGFKGMGLPASVSGPSMSKENEDKYSCTMILPWSVETSWRVEEDALKLREFFLELTIE